MGEAGGIVTDTINRDDEVREMWDDEHRQGDEDTVKTVPWPILSDTAMHGTAGRIVQMIAPHTEADPAALLAQLLAAFGCAIGTDPHIVVGNQLHHARVWPLIVGRTNEGAKGTSLGAVLAVLRTGLPWFTGDFFNAGLSSAEGLIEQVRDPSDGDPEDKNYDPGVEDKRLIVVETEYRSVMERGRREGNSLSPVLRQAWDDGDLRTMTRKANALRATGAHIVIIAHITPREFQGTLADRDLAGGSVNRMLICLSRRSRLHSRFGNIPDDVLAEAGSLIAGAYGAAQAHAGKLDFTSQFWARWDVLYRELNRDRPDSWATDATARGVAHVLRLSMIYALMDAEKNTRLLIDAPHLEAAKALWDYADHSARWLFSTHELEQQGSQASGLVAFIRDAGAAGRTRTDIYRGYFKSNVKASEIDAQLTPIVHNGVVVEEKRTVNHRTITVYVHREQRIDVFTQSAVQGDFSNVSGTYSYVLSDPSAYSMRTQYVAETIPELGNA